MALPARDPKKHPFGRPSASLMLYSALALLLCFIPVYLIGFSDVFAVKYSRADADGMSEGVKALLPKPKPAFDTAAYDRKMLALANTGTTTASTTPAWPAKGPYPKMGALLPDKRIIAFYGNFYSKGMGVLGEYPEDVVIQKLRAEMAAWDAADPTTKAIPAIDYIVTTAQGSPGKDGMYRFRMPDSQVQIALALAEKVDGIVIFDVQVGLSDIPSEVRALEPYLKLPNVHLALDPEFSMKTKDKPGDVIGTMNSTDINWTIDYLSDLVKAGDLPPKVLIVHRFTQNMLRDAEGITPTPEVQVVIDMDGWGSPAKKINTYRTFVASEPVQFTGFKLFYKNDLKAPSTRLLTPSDLLKLTPRPSFIQYQ